MRAARRVFMSIVDRLGLLEPTFRLYEATLAARGRLRERSTQPRAGLPLPPPKLRVLVAGTASADWFIESGERIAKAIEEALEEAGTSLARQRSVLEFGCGSGRVIRHLSELGADVYGTDSNPALVAWCAEHLTFGTFNVNANEPPLDYEAGVFDLVYTISVFTHMAWEAQAKWLAELHRVLRPRGLLLLTAHGIAYKDRLIAGERERFDIGHVVVRHESASGTNVCAAYHPEEFVRERMAPPLFSVRAFLPARAVLQDVYVLEALTSTGNGETYSS